MNDVWIGQLTVDISHLWFQNFIVCLEIGSKDIKLCSTAIPEGWVDWRKLHTFADGLNKD